jgi:hypothetical protein
MKINQDNKHIEMRNKTTRGRGMEGCSQPSINGMAEPKLYTNLTF